MVAWLPCSPSTANARKNGAVRSAAGTERGVGRKARCFGRTPSTVSGLREPRLCDIAERLHRLRAGRPAETRALPASQAGRQATRRRRGSPSDRPAPRRRPRKNMLTSTSARASFAGAAFNRLFASAAVSGFGWSANARFFSSLRIRMDTASPLGSCRSGCEFGWLITNTAGAATPHRQRQQYRHLRTCTSRQQRYAAIETASDKLISRADLTEAATYAGAQERPGEHDRQSTGPLIGPLSNGEVETRHPLRDSLLEAHPCRAPSASASTAPPGVIRRSGQPARRRSDPSPTAYPARNSSRTSM